MLTRLHQLIAAEAKFNLVFSDARENQANVFIRDADKHGICFQVRVDSVLCFAPWSSIVKIINSG